MDSPQTRNPLRERIEFFPEETVGGGSVQDAGGMKL
jgi:hypothetical protein